MADVAIDLSGVPDAVNPHFYPLLNCRKRYQVCYGGAGSGKSHFIAQKILLRIVDGMPLGIKHRFVCFRKTAPAARKSVFELFKHYIVEWGWHDLLVNRKPNETTMTFKFINGSEVRCGGLDDPEKLKSLEGATGVWIEECTEVALRDFQQIDLRLRGVKPSYKQICMSFNPVSKLNWVYGRFFQSNGNGADTTQIDHSTWRDNNFLDDEYIDLLKDLHNQDPTTAMIYEAGEWGQLGNLIYNNWQQDDTISRDEEDYENVLRGMDFGFNHPSVMLTMGYKDQTLYIFDELVARKLTNQQWCDVVEKQFTDREWWRCLQCRHVYHEDMPHDEGGIRHCPECDNTLWQDKQGHIVADCAEPDRIKELKGRGLQVTACEKGKGSVKNGIDYCRRLQIKVHPECTRTIAELQGYKYREDKEGNVFDEPVPFNDDAMSAMRYGLEPLRLSNKAKIRKM